MGLGEPDGDRARAELVRMMDFFRAGPVLLPFSKVAKVVMDDLEVELKIVVHMENGEEHTLESVDTIDFLMAVKPSALEGRRLKWMRNAWVLHNLVGHPLMQILSLFGWYGAAMRVHDGTIPRPLDMRS